MTLGTWDDNFGQLSSLFSVSSKMKIESRSKNFATTMWTGNRFQILFPIKKGSIKKKDR